MGLELGLKASVGLEQLEWKVLVDPVQPEWNWVLVARQLDLWWEGLESLSLLVLKEALAVEMQMVGSGHRWWEVDLAARS